MELKQNLQLGAKEFFDAIAKSVSYDVSQAVGKTVKPEQLYSGFRYTKKMKNKVGRSGDVQVIIKQFNAPVNYEAVFRSAQGENFVSYHIEELQGGSIMVHYEEGYEGDSTAKSLNYKLMSKLYDRKARKRVTQMLKSMEQYINSST